MKRCGGDEAAERRRWRWRRRKSSAGKQLMS